GSVVPGPTGTPAAAIRFRALILSPMASMASGPGPTQTSPAASTARAKPAFSDRNPYPGCTASAPVDFAAARIASVLRYDWAGLAGPIRTDSSASATNGSPASASEYTATVRIASRRGVHST